MAFEVDRQTDRRRDEQTINVLMAFEVDRQTERRTDRQSDEQAEKDMNITDG
jgi:hypothetical protein